MRSCWRKFTRSSRASGVLLPRASLISYGRSTYGIGVSCFVSSRIGKELRSLPPIEHSVVADDPDTSVAHHPHSLWFDRQPSTRRSTVRPQLTTPVCLDYRCLRTSHSPLDLAETYRGRDPQPHCILRVRA